MSPDMMNYVLAQESIDTIIHAAAQTHVDNSFGNSLVSQPSSHNIRHHAMGSAGFIPGRVIRARYCYMRRLAGLNYSVFGQFRRGDRVAHISHKSLNGQRHTRTDREYVFFTQLYTRTSKFKSCNCRHESVF